MLSPWLRSRESRHGPAEQLHFNMQSGFYRGRLESALNKYNESAVSDDANVQF